MTSAKFLDQMRVHPVDRFVRSRRGSGYSRSTLAKEGENRKASASMRCT